ncbi:MAG: CDP-alcohol phosphatidyltransferase family protein [Pseudomonadota bacterium]
MLDGSLKPRVEPYLTKAGSLIASIGITANQITVAGLGVGLIAAAAIAFQYFWIGAFLIVVSRIFDGLDGAVARASKPSDFGGFLDIVLDFIFYGAIPIAFAVADPSANALAAAILVFSFYVNGASFLAFAIMAEKQKLKTDQRGSKSFFFTTGLAEATETYAFFIAFCLFPAFFAEIAYVFTVICFYTALSRIVMTSRVLK